MFPIATKQDLPVNQIVIRSVSVRGYLGPLTVWISNQGLLPRENDAYHHWGQAQFTCLYEKHHEASRRAYQTLEFPQPLVLQPGEERVLYIHSKAPHDRAIVYDNSHLGGDHHHRARYEDAFLQIRSGKAHLSPTVFGETPIWGWGSAWRAHREFVGQVQYGVVYQLWQPERHLRFGRNFQEAAHTIFACQRRVESPVARLPDECIFYILNMCKWDWFEDDAEEMTDLRHRLRNITASRSIFPRTRSNDNRSSMVINRRQSRRTTQQRNTDENPRQERPFRFGLATVRNLLTAAPSS